MPWMLQKVSALGVLSFPATVWFPSRSQKMERIPLPPSAASFIRAFFVFFFAQTNVFVVKRGRLTQTDPFALK